MFAYFYQLITRWFREPPKEELIPVDDDIPMESKKIGEESYECMEPNPIIKQTKDTCIEELEDFLKSCAEGCVIDTSEA